MKPSNIALKRSFAILTVLLLLFLPVRLPSGAAAESAADEFQRFWPITNNNTENTSTAVDAHGGVHMAFSAYTSVNGIRPVYYGYCASNCGVRASWTFIPVSDLGTFGGYVRLEIDPSGRPRMLWFQVVSLNEDGVYQYAQCNSACTNAGNWSILSLTSDAVGPENSRYFALDSQGRPRFLYTDTNPDHRGTFYVFCDSSCTTLNNWYEGNITDAYLLYSFSLAFSASGEVRLAFRNATGVPDTLDYAECSANCGSADSWNSLTLVEPLGYDGTFSLDLDPQGRPRLAYFSGYFDSSSPDNDLLAYAWCNTNCLYPTNWTIRDVGLPAGYGKDVDLVVDAQNRLHLAYYIDDIEMSTYGLGYSVCTANCTGSLPTWTDQLVEVPEDLDASDPVPVQSPCTISAWMEVGEEPSLAVDAAGKPYIGYNAVHGQGGPCVYKSDIRLVRYAQLGSGTPPGGSDYKVYLALTRR